MIRNTLVAGNLAPGSPDLLGSLDSQGHNLIGDGTGGSGFDATDLVGTADYPIGPKLGPLQDNGGLTETMALLPGSPAIDAGDNTDAPEWDQRGPGFHRIVNGTIDIGAFEVQAHAHNRPTGQPLPDPVSVQALGMPNRPLPGQLPDRSADPTVSSPGPVTQVGQPPASAAEVVPLSPAGGQQAADSFFGGATGDGPLATSMGSLPAGDLE